MEGPKSYSLDQVSAHKTKGDCWFVIAGKVYDVTSFLEEHPGGEEVLIEASGGDATMDFEDVGHSETAKSMMETYEIGLLEGYEFVKKDEISSKREKTAFKEIRAPPTIKNEEPSIFMKLLQFLVPLLIVGVAFGVRSFLKETQPSS